MQQNNISLLAKQAIREALSGNWDKAIEINLGILENNPNGVDAKLRLGHAYIQTKHLIKAKKVFNEVIETDPLNPIALKNLQLINKKVDVISPIKAVAGALIKEPGTTTETTINLTGRGMSAESFAPGENLLVKIKKTSATLFRLKKDKEIEIGEIQNPDLVKSLNKAQNENTSVTASFIKGVDRRADILIKCSLPIFKSEKQDIRPYIKKGSLDDAEMEDEEQEVELS